MVPYDTFLKTWQKRNVRSVSDLDLQLKHFRILFAYHLSKIENENIAFQDVREIFENGKVVGYTGAPRTLFP